MTRPDIARDAPLFVKYYIRKRHRFLSEFMARINASPEEEFLSNPWGGTALLFPATSTDAGRTLWKTPFVRTGDGASLPGGRDNDARTPASPGPSLKRRPLHINPIKCEQDYWNCLAEIDALIESGENGAGGDRLDVLATLALAWEQKDHPHPPIDPITALRRLMASRRMTRRDLEPLLGGRAAVAAVLNRRRALTSPMIQRLHNGLGMSLDVLLAPPRDQRHRIAALPNANKSRSQPHRRRRCGEHRDRSTRADQSSSNTQFIRSGKP